MKYQIPVVRVLLVYRVSFFIVQLQVCKPDVTEELFRIFDVPGIPENGPHLNNLIAT